MSYQYRIDKAILRNGQQIEFAPLTVIVGPNNSGKSQILKDILNLTTEQDRRGILLKDLEFTLPKSFIELARAYDVKSVVRTDGTHHLTTLAPMLSGNKSLNVGKEGWEKTVDGWINNQDSKGSFNHLFGSFLVNYLSTEDRLKLV